MRRLFRSLNESLKLLLKRPDIFIPKIVSSLIGSAWFLGLLTGILPLWFLLVSLIPVSIVGVFASLLVASVVKKEQGLIEGFKELVHLWKKAVYISLLFMFLGFIVALPASTGLFIFMATGSVMALLTGVSLSLLMMFAIVFSSYFLPIALIEEEKLLGSVKSSLSTSVSSPVEVISLTVFSFVLLGLTFGSNQYLELLGYAGFVLGRLLSAIVTTYIFVVSPKYYLES